MYTRCDKAACAYFVAAIRRTSLNSCDRLQRQNSVAVTMIFTCHTRRFVVAACRGDVSQQLVASCVSALNVAATSPLDLCSRKYGRIRNISEIKVNNEPISSAAEMAEVFNYWIKFGK